MKPWPANRKIISLQLDFLNVLVMGCDVWTAPYVYGPLDTTNNRIYTAM